ncbi:major phosphate-irrepressible acid phosphatase precursor [Komagataeibacter europaeus]|uniref:Acid phosphatase n=1 Tax=Komagataeibacter europaeus TaxID=33995 RepID=A0A0M0EJC3_KOMEU|nr:phosphatase PAP2 family protein [Komagataeibacter europaeus]KON65359.1 major phosphate-irrepressible acid phosphatase precursor [Komagataeibacter europaeus]
MRLDRCAMAGGLATCAMMTLLAVVSVQASAHPHHHGTGVVHHHAAQAADTVPAGPPLPDGQIFLPPPPGPDTAQRAADASIFAATRVLEGTPRWKLAQADNRDTPAHMVSAFSCAAGFTLPPDHLPELVGLVTRIEQRLTPAVHAQKMLWNRPRPFTEAELSTCIPLRASLRQDPSYPSLHATLGWVTGLILSDILPERTAWIMQRARVFGESRVVCGVQWQSDVMAAWLNGGVLYSAMEQDEGFRQEMDAARAEVVALHPTMSAPPAEECAVEADAAAHPPQ